MTYQEWEAQVPDVIKCDSLWRVEVYRLSEYLSDLAWHDAHELLRNGITHDTARQLFRAVGKISSNISEGYSRNTGKARAIYYEYALGSAHETRGWYYKGRHVLGAETCAARLDLATRIIRLSITMANQERRTNRKIVQDS